MRKPAGKFVLKAMPDEASPEANLAFDILIGGEWTALAVEGAGRARADALKKIGTTAWLEARKKALADFIRSTEPIPDVFRAALADAIDGQGNPAVRIALRNARKRPLFATTLNQSDREMRALEAYDAARARGDGYEDAKDEAFKAVGTNERDGARMLSSANARRDRLAAINEAFDAGRPIGEIAELARRPLDPPRPGRRRRAPKR